MKRFGWLVLLFALPSLAMGADPPRHPERRMAITIDDLPIAQTSWHDQAQMDRITAGLLRTLGEHAVPVIGFVNEGKLEVDGNVDPFRLSLLRRWAEQRLELGNHGYAHLDLHRVPPEEWMAEDPVYQKPIHGWTGRGGITWLHRWAITEGVDRSVFQGEPVLPQWVEDVR